MVNHRRVMIASDPLFRDNLKRLKIKLMMDDNEISLPKLTSIMAKPEIFDEIEKRVLADISRNRIGIPRLDIISFDRRKK